MFIYYYICSHNLRLLTKHFFQTLPFFVFNDFYVIILLFTYYIKRRPTHVHTPNIPLIKYTFDTHIIIEFKIVNHVTVLNIFLVLSLLIITLINKAQQISFSNVLTRSKFSNKINTFGLRDNRDFIVNNYCIN